MGQTSYQEGKEKARKEAIEWAYDFADNNCTYSELAYYQDHFTKLGKRYGLLKEFRENGII